MIRSAQTARPVLNTVARFTLLTLSVIASLLVVSGTAKAVTDVGPYSLYTTAELCKLTVAPKDAAQPVGAQQTFTATLTAIGPDVPLFNAVEATVPQTHEACGYKQIDALAGVTVAFKVVSGPNAGKTEDVALNDSGVANFTITSAVAGVDVVEASLVLPDICFAIGNPQVAPAAAAAVELPAACANWFGDVQPLAAAALPPCRDIQVEALVDECLTVTLKDSGQVTWSAPEPQVVAEADPSLKITAFKRCVSRRFKITPVYSGGAIRSSTLFVDGKKKQTKQGAEPFSLSARSYKRGKHNFEVVTVFSNGKAASKFGSFSRCAARVTVKHISPKFTG